MIDHLSGVRGILLTLILSLWVTGTAYAALISDISNTKHNFSATVTPQGVDRLARATTESQICAFCHTDRKSVV